MWLKTQIVGKTNRTYLYEKRGLRIYYETGADREPTRNAAWAIDSEHPNIALRLESNIKEADFKKILYSITTKSEGK